MISIKIDETRREAEEVILGARKEASGMIVNSEREGKKIADEYYRKEMERINAETDQLKKRGDEDSKSVLKRGERNVSLAAEKIVRTVTME